MKGFTISEIMIALLISMLLLFMVITFFINIKSQMLYVHAKTDLYQRAEQLTAVFRHFTRNAGFTGCSKSDVKTLTGEPAVKIIDSYNNLPFVKNSQGLELQTTALPISNVLAMLEHGTQLIASKPFAWKTKHSLLIADCVHAFILKSSDKIQNNDKYSKRITLVNAVPYKINKYAVITRWQHIIFYIRNTKRKYSIANEETINALFMKTDNAASDELIPGVVDMRVEKILSMNRTARTGNIKIKAIKIHLLLSSMQAVGNWEKTIKWQGRVYATHNRILIPWNITIAPRNHVIL